MPDTDPIFRHGPADSQRPPPGHGFGHLPGLSLRSISMQFALVCVVVFVGVHLLDALRLVGRGEVFSLFGLSHHGVFQQGRLWQVVTSPLMHQDVMHLVFNMLLLWWFGPMIEERLGKARYALLLAASLAGGTIAFLAMHAGKPVVVVGASALDYGLLVAMAFLYPQQVIRLFWVFPVKLKYAVWILAGIAFFLTNSRDADNLSHVSHLGGLVGGLLFMLAHTRMALLRRGARPGPPGPASGDWATWAAQKGKLFGAPRGGRRGKKPKAPKSL